MKMLVFASRNRKEILRDPLNLSFGIGFPAAVLLLLTAIQANIPVKIFTLDALTPGIVTFGFSFIALFSGILISKDRASSFTMRLYASPLSPSGFILGYLLPLVPIAVLQSAFCFLLALVLGLELTVNILLAMLVLFPSAVFNIALGLICGSLLNDKQVGGICGAALTNLSAWLSGTWFDLNLVGGAFKKIAYALPFAHAVDAGRAAYSGNYGDIWGHLAVVLVYAAVAMIAAVIIFKRKMHV